MLGCGTAVSGTMMRIGKNSPWRHAWHGDPWRVCNMRADGRLRDQISLATPDCFGSNRSRVAVVIVARVVAAAHATHHIRKPILLSTFVTATGFCLFNGCCVGRGIVFGRHFNSFFFGFLRKFFLLSLWATFFLFGRLGFFFLSIITTARVRSFVVLVIFYRISIVFAFFPILADCGSCFSQGLPSLANCALKKSKEK